MTYAGNTARVKACLPDRVRMSGALFVLTALLWGQMAFAQISVPEFPGMVYAKKNERGHYVCPEGYLWFDSISRIGPDSEPYTCMAPGVCTPGKTYDAYECSRKFDQMQDPRKRMVVYERDLLAAAQEKPAKPATQSVQPPQPAPPFTVEKVWTYGRCMDVKPGPTKWMKSDENSWHLDATIILENTCEEQQLVEAQILPPTGGIWFRPMWTPQNFIEPARRLWRGKYPEYTKYGFSPQMDGQQVFIVPGKGILHARQSFYSPHAKIPYPNPPYVIQAKAYSCPHFVHGSEYTVFTDGSHENFRCVMLPDRIETVDRPGSYSQNSKYILTGEIQKECDREINAYATTQAERLKTKILDEFSHAWAQAAKVIQLDPLQTSARMQQLEKELPSASRTMEACMLTVRQEQFRRNYITREPYELP